MTELLLQWHERCLNVLFHLDSRTIDLLDWNSLINDTTKISNLLMVPSLEVSHCQVIVDSDSGLGRCLMLCNKRASYNVCLFLYSPPEVATVPSDLSRASRESVHDLMAPLTFEVFLSKSHMALKKEVGFFF